MKNMFLSSNIRSSGNSIPDGDKTPIYIENFNIKPLDIVSFSTSADQRINYYLVNSFRYIGVAVQFNRTIKLAHVACYDVEEEKFITLPSQNKIWKAIDLMETYDANYNKIVGCGRLSNGNYYFVASYNTSEIYLDKEQTLKFYVSTTGNNKTFNPLFTTYSESNSWNVVNDLFITRMTLGVNSKRCEIFNAFTGVKLNSTNLTTKYDGFYHDGLFDMFGNIFISYVNAKEKDIKSYEFEFMKVNVSDNSSEIISIPITTDSNTSTYLNIRFFLKDENTLVLYHNKLTVDGTSCFIYFYNISSATIEKTLEIPFFPFTLNSYEAYLVGDEIHFAAEYNTIVNIVKMTGDSFETVYTKKVDVFNNDSPYPVYINNPLKNIYKHKKQWLHYTCKAKQETTTLGFYTFGYVEIFRTLHGYGTLIPQ